MSTPLFKKEIDEAIRQLKKDLLAEGGTTISTMRNYRFAILVYDPKDEFILRQRIQSLTSELQQEHWNVLALSLRYHFMRRLEQLSSREQEQIIKMEERQYSKGNPARALRYLQDKISPLIEGRDGIAADVIQAIDRFAQTYPDEADRSLIFLTQTGSLYPFLRSSALLKHLDGKTRNLPVVLLYPGLRKDYQSLSFMGELDADRDYRPRIYSG